MAGFFSFTITMAKATVDDLTVARNSDGELIPTEGELPDILDENGDPKTGDAVPMTYGDVMEYFGSAKSVEDIDSDLIARIIDNHVVTPDLSEAAGGEVTGEFVEKELPPLVPRSLLLMVFEASGMTADVEMKDEGGATVDFDATGNEN